MRVIPTNEFNIGNDTTVDVLDPVNGGIQSFTLLTGFTAQQQTQEVRSNALDGLTRFAHLPDGWSGTLTYDRANSQLDDYFSRREDGYYAGRVQPPCTITQTVREVNGGVSQYRFEGVSFGNFNAGNAQGKDKVEQSVDWMASRRKKVF